MKLSRDRPAWWREILLIAVTYGIYTATRNTLPSHRALATANAMDVLHLEQRLHIDVEHALNDFVAHQAPHAIAVLSNYAYSLSHFTVTAGALVWLYVVHASAYRLARNVLLVTTLLGLLGFWLFPLAPPRFFPQLGFVDTVVRDATWGSWGSGAVTAISNQYAAMPSIHVAWSLWVAVVVALVARRRWVKVLAAAYPVVVLFVIVVTANHWVLDAAGGAAALCLGAVVAIGVRGLGERGLGARDLRLFSARHSGHFFEPRGADAEVAMAFADRVDAGRRLAAALDRFAGKDVVVVGLPRGGIPVAYEVAHALGAPLDVIVVRKLGVPFQPELGMGAVGEGGVRIINDEVVREARIGEHTLEEVERRERAEVEERARRFRGDRAPVPLAGRTVVVVDDGIATGSTARAACQVARAHGAAHVVLAVPVGPPGVAARMRPAADEVVCLETPAWFFAIGEFYDDFSQTTDTEVVALLEQAARRGPPAGVEAEVTVRAGDVPLAGRLCVPPAAVGVVVFAHGSGSSRHSPRNRFVASVLNDAGVGTLLFDLLTVDEEADRGNVFDIELLAHRLVLVTRWLQAQPAATGRSIGYFGASTGAAAALRAAAELGDGIAAVVSRGGRPDLAGDRLRLVRAPTLLIVGGLDDVVVDLNRVAQAELLACESRLEIVPGATHLFEEPGTLEVAAHLARDWFAGHLTPVARAAR